ncbi:hypothetical protein AOQ84DRAFT_419307 [Glonium stellatum]|uniref:HypA n=1 Tax=Glonium stellatum TaxID=574774 RepID=A0A8E2FDY9_9PEZI|nr:hypothetical protein AOQ84DRAFT_419307 [Glonium stellatum]
MATAHIISLSPSQNARGVRVTGLTQESADKASTLLMQNHAKYHVYFNEAGLHNHIVHHMLSLYALGATPDELQAGYDLNQQYQLPAIKLSDSEINLNDPVIFRQCLGESKYYQEFIAFFQSEISRKGVPDVVNEFVFKRDEAADDMLLRMFSGFLHPILHLGFGLEFDQPCIVAESLAQAAIHDSWPEKILLPAEKLSLASSAPRETTLIELQASIRADPVVSTAVQWSDPPNKVTHGLVPRALNELLPHLARYVVSSSELAKKTAEMIHAGIYMLATSQQPQKPPMFDFFLMHSANLSYFFTIFLDLTWISTENKCRLLEWKARMDLTIYAATRTPVPYPSRIHCYVPKQPGGWGSIYARVRKYKDDGHTSKLIRSVRCGEIVSKPYIGSPGFELSQGVFLKIAHMVMDSVDKINELRAPDALYRMYKAGGVDDEVIKVITRWVRWCGFEQAWLYVPSRSNL